MDIKTIGVIGAGAMGSGIAQVAATAGFQVIMRDIEDRFVEKGMTGIEKFLTKSVDRLHNKFLPLHRINPLNQ
jgi:3-hydroxybutyryl-CoA dehydrogenase